MSKFAEETLAESLPKAAKGGEWDGDVVDFDSAESEEIEISEDGDEEESEEEPDESDADEPDSEEPEEDSDPEVAEEIEEDEPEEQEEELGARANKRVRQVLAQKKAAEDQLALVLAQFQATQQQDLAFRQHQYQVQEQARLAQAAEQARLQRLQDLQVNGLFDPGSKADQFALSLHQEFEAQQQKLARLEQALQQREYQAQWQEYHQKVDNSLRSTLKGYAIEDADLETFRRQVVAFAVQNDLADPSVAVQQVVTPFLKFMKPTAKAAPKPARVLSEDEKAAHRAVATRAPAGTKKKGQKASGGSHGRKTVKSALDEMYGEAEWG